MSIIRLDKFLTSQNISSRKNVKDLVKKGLIKVNDYIVKKSDVKVDTEKDKVYFNDEFIEYSEYIYIMLNKPKGVVSATDDKKNKTVLDLVPDSLFRKGIFPAGRLDKDTTGFVLLTNNGDFAHKILSPKNHIEKTYIAELKGHFDENYVKCFLKGIVLEDGTVCQSAKIKLLEEKENSCLVEIIICEGKYHQIKRMAESVGSKVLELKRIKMGNLELDKNLKLGECKVILHKEIDVKLSNIN